MASVIHFYLLSVLCDNSLHEFELNSRTRAYEKNSFKGVRVLKPRLAQALHPSEEGAKGAIRVRDF